MARGSYSDEYSLYAPRRFDPVAIIGLFATLLLHGGIVGVVYARRLAEANRPPPPAETYVVARLVRLGKKREPKLLPQKVVPQPATVKPEAVSYDADASDPPKPKDKKPDPDAKLSDKMRQSLEKAALLNEAQREIEAEGDPSGVAGGTATEAGEGDPYMTRIADLWIRTWTLPAIIPREEAKQLSVLMVLRIDERGQIEFPIVLDKSSGNEHFDNSVKAAWQQIKELPLPPPERLPSILANGMALKLTWRGLQ